MKLSEMRRVLEEQDIELTKSLGQNFLHDANQLRRIEAAAELRPEDKVLEIGPGLGVLTELLLDKAGSVLAIEKDVRLIEALSSRWNERAQGKDSRLTLVHDDALKYLRREQRDWTEWKMVSNLPYSVASPILVELAQAEQGPERMVVTLQLEVARRIMAGPRDPNYGVLTLLVGLDYEARQFFKIPASCFFPEPEVDSACVTLVKRPRPLLAMVEKAVFTRVVKRSFSQRRKMMLKLLKADWPAETLVRILDQLQLSTQTRAETVSLEQFITLTRALGG